jgi:NAD(P)-dependent dehydrogenase (short-subunit alcohol dehydrogenase family)
MRKIAIITGASSGIGGATAVALAERGVDSIVTFNSHEDRVRDVVEAVRKEAPRRFPCASTSARARVSSPSGKR